MAAPTNEVSDPAGGVEFRPAYPDEFQRVGSFLLGPGAPGKTDRAFLGVKSRPAERIVAAAALGPSLLGGGRAERFTWDVLPQLRGGPLPTAFLAALCRDAAGRGVESLQKVGVTAADSWQAAALAAAGFRVRHREEQFEFAVEDCRERTWRMLAKRRGRGPLLPDPCRVEKLTQDNADAAFAVLGAHGLMERHVFDRGCKDGSLLRYSAVLMAGDSAACGALFCRRVGEGSVMIEVIAVNPGPVPAGVATAALIEVAIPPAQRDGVTLARCRANPQTNPATARLVAGFNARRLPDLFGYAIDLPAAPAAPHPHTEPS